MLNCVDWQQLYSLADGDEHFVRALLQSFVADGDRQMRELRQAIDQQDYQSAHHHIHQIKGASANVGALRVEAIATQIEVYLYAVTRPTIDPSTSATREMPSDEPMIMGLADLETAIAQIRAIVAEQGTEE